MCTSDVCLALLAILFPPIAVWIKCGICTADSLINIALCCLGFVPGLIHAWYALLSPSPLSPSHISAPSVLHSRKLSSPRRDSASGFCKLPADAPHRYMIAKHPESDYEPVAGGGGDGGENGRVVYRYVGGPQQGPGQQGQQQQRGYGTVQGGRAEGGGSQSGGVPPSYEQAVKGDHKVQT